MLTGESAEADSTCTKVWHNPSSSRRGREPPGRHLSSARSQCRATEVDACNWPLCQALRPDSRTVAEATVAHLVVMPRVVSPKAFYVASSPGGELPAARISRASDGEYFNSPRIIRQIRWRHPRRVAPVHTVKGCTTRPARRPMPFGQPEGCAVSLL
jgi:hypothetical protein